MLAPDIHLIVVVRRNMDRKRPVETVLGHSGMRAIDGFRPDMDCFDMSCPVIHPLQHGIVASSPDNVGVHRIRDDESALPASRCSPERRGTSPPSEASGAGTFIRRPVLLASVDVIGNLVIHVDMIHLSDWKSDPLESFATVAGDDDSAVIADHETVRVFGIRPHIMAVSAPAHGLGCVAAVKCPALAVGGKINLILIPRIDHNPGGIMRPFIQDAVVADQPPALPSVVRAPEDSAVRMSGLHQCVDDIRIAVRDGDTDLSDGR